MNVRGLLIITGLLLIACLPGFSDEPMSSANVTQLMIKGPHGTLQVSGQILVEAQDGGVLLEERNGRIRQLTPAVIESKTTSDVPFSAMTNDEMQVPAGFEIHQTDHYVICSNSAEEYSEFVGKLLEKVFDQYFEFLSEQEIAVRQPAGKLPVIILQSEAES